MKTMTCHQLGGACDATFTANTFEEIAQLSKNHGMEMFKNNDTPHLEAMQKMRDYAQTPNAMERWYAEKKELFNSLPDHK